MSMPPHVTPIDWGTDYSPRYLKVRVENCDGDCTQCGCPVNGDSALTLICDRLDVPDYWLCRSCAQHFAMRIDEMVKYTLGVDISLTCVCGHERHVHSTRNGTLPNTGPCMHCERCTHFTDASVVARNA